MTPNSSSTPYLSASDFLNFQDWNLVAQLCADAPQGGNPVPVLLANLPTNPNLAAALAAASGELESACLRGERYAVADLQSLNGNSQLLMKRIVSAITMITLWDRRDAPDPPANVVRKAEWAEKYLDRLASGEAVFAFQETEDAGLPDSGLFVESDLMIRGDITAVAFRPMFGNRSNTKMPPLGF